MSEEISKSKNQKVLWKKYQEKNLKLAHSINPNISAGFQKCLSKRLKAD